MNDKNKFSCLLEHLMTVTGIKNYIIAKELQYDVSYISKWVSGRMLPAEKSASMVLQGISRCLIGELEEKSRKRLYEDYQVNSDKDLQEAIYDNLFVAYTYSKDMEKKRDIEIRSDSIYYPKLTLQQFSVKMNHPVLRNVKALDIVTAMDILSMSHEYRLMLVRLEQEALQIRGEYKNVHYNMLINLQPERLDYVYDTIFLTNMLTKLTHLDFSLYEGMKAYGKIIFAVKNAYSISGMLFDSDRVMAVNVSENEETCNILYNEVKTACRREALLLRKSDMQEILNQQEYVQLMISRNIRGLFGKIMEYFLPQDLWAEIFEREYLPEKWKVEKGYVEQVHRLVSSVLEEAPLRLMIYETAFIDFAVSGVLDFYNQKIILTPEERARCIGYFLDLMERNKNLQVHLIHGKFISDFQYDATPCIFLSDTVSYLRLYNKNYQNNIVVLNHAAIIHMFDRFYEEIWEYGKGIVIADQDKVIDSIRHVEQSVKILARMDGC